MEERIKVERGEVWLGGSTTSGESKMGKNEVKKQLH